jgi:hypothetical protein
LVYEQMRMREEKCHHATGWRDGSGATDRPSGEDVVSDSSRESWVGGGDIRDGGGGCGGGL